MAALSIALSLIVPLQQPRRCWSDGWIHLIACVHSRWTPGLEFVGKAGACPRGGRRRSVGECRRRSLAGHGIGHRGYL